MSDKREIEQAIVILELWAFALRHKLECSPELHKHWFPEGVWQSAPSSRVIRMLKKFGRETEE